MNEQVSACLTAVAGLPQVHRRLQRVEVRNLPAIEFIQRYDHSDCLFYCDPPYLHETRSSTGEYAREMSDQEHQQLLECLVGIRGKFLLSGYPSQMYSDWADSNDYRCIRIEIDVKASGRRLKERKTECIWCGP